VTPDLLAQLEACTLPPECFHHAGHVRAAWLYLNAHPLPEAIVRFSRSLRAYATHLGKPDLYHETITWAYLLLIHERIARSGESQDWARFTAENADLFDWNNSVLKKYYRDETLASDFAKRVFVMPDRR
jgi:hypothetical protein